MTSTTHKDMIASTVPGDEEDLLTRELNSPKAPTEPHFLALEALRDSIAKSIDDQFAADPSDNHEKKMETAAIAMINTMRATDNALKTTYENREFLSKGPLQNTAVNLHLFNNVPQLLATTTSYQEADDTERAIMEHAFNSNRGTLIEAFARAFFKRLEERAPEIPTK